MTGSYLISPLKKLITVLPTFFGLRTSFQAVSLFAVNLYRESHLFTLFFSCVLIALFVGCLEGAFVLTLFLLPQDLILGLFIRKIRVTGFTGRKIFVHVVHL